MNFKQIFLTTSYLVISNLSFAQVWSLNELIKVINMNVDDADTFITSKGYKYSSSEQEESVEGRVYSYGMTLEYKSEYWLTIYTKYYNKKSSVSWQTTKINQYVSLKKQVKSSGFTFLNSEVKKDGSTVFKYQKGKNIISIFTREQEIPDKIINQYRFDIDLLK